MQLDDRILYKGDRVSVVVPTFEDGRFLERCLETIEAQTFAAAEIVVVDDGSTNPMALSELRAALHRFPKAKLLKQAHAGAAAARNRGLVHCANEFVVFVDVDDELRPNNFEVKRSLFSESSNIIATYGGFIAIDSTGKRSSSCFKDYCDSVDPALIGSLGGIPGGLPLYMFRTSALRAIGGLDESLTIMEDFDALIRLGRNGGQIAGCNKPIYVRRLRADSLTRSSARKTFFGSLKFLKKARQNDYFTNIELARRYCTVVIRFFRQLL